MRQVSKKQVMFLTVGKMEMPSISKEWNSKQLESSMDLEPGKLIKPMHICLEILDSSTSPIPN